MSKMYRLPIPKKNIEQIKTEVAAKRAATQTLTEDEQRFYYDQGYRDGRMDERTSKTRALVSGDHGGRQSEPTDEEVLFLQRTLKEAGLPLSTDAIRRVEKSQRELQRAAKLIQRTNFRTPSDFPGTAGRTG